MKKTWILMVAALWLGTILVTGCGPCAERSAQPEIAKPPPRPPAPPPKAPPPKPGVRLISTGPEGPCSYVGAGTVRVYHPGGESAGSPILIERTAPETVRVGDVFEYQMKITNATDVALEKVRVHETFPPNLTVKAAGPQPVEITKSEATWAFPDLKAGATQIIIVKAAVTEVGTYRPCVSVTYEPRCVGIKITAIQPKLELLKTVPAQALTCEIIPMTLTVRNTGTGSANNVVIRDTLPKGMTTMDGKTELVLNAGNLDAGQARQFADKLKVTAASEYANAATATADGGLTAKSNQATTTVSQPQLTVTKTGPRMRYVGRPVVYTISVANKGEVPATKTVLSDTVPPGVAFVKATGGGTLRDGNVVWDLGTIPVDEAKEVTVTLQPQETGDLRTTATARAVCVTAQDSATTTIQGIPAILLETVDIEDPIEVGSNVTYVITVTNQGSAVGTNIVVTCQLPAEQDFVSATGPTKETVEAKALTFAPLATLAPQARAVYRVTVKGTKAGDVRFTVSLKSDQMTSPAGETESTHIYE